MLLKSLAEKHRAVRQTATQSGCGHKCDQKTVAVRGAASFRVSCSSFRGAFATMPSTPPYLQPTPRGTKMRAESLAFCLLLCLGTLPWTGCGWLSRPKVSGVWKGSIECSDKRGHKWNGPAELTLNQNGDGITGTLAFTQPQAGRIQVPIPWGAVSKDAVTFSGQSRVPLGTIELCFHGKAEGNSLTGTAEYRRYK
jgi:hypothetical protein